MSSEKTDLQLAERHRYRLVSGGIAINVTAITGMLDLDGKSARMAGAAVKLTKEGKNHRDEWKARADRGTRVHNACERWLQGERASFEPEDKPYLDALELFFEQHAPEPIEIERVVLCELGNGVGYGGRFDFIADFDNKRSLVDIKTGRRYGLEHTLQLSAYRYADGLAVYDDSGSLAWLTNPPPVDRAGCLYLQPDEDEPYAFVEYPADEAAWSTFADLVQARHDIERLKARLPE